CILANLRIPTTHEKQQNMDKYDLFLCFLVTVHIMLCPFTKVEESFNLQATHDIMEYGMGPESLKKFDHFEFPGVVHRTFVGPLLLSGASWPTVKTLEIFFPDFDKFFRQYVVRFYLGLSGIFALSKLRLSISTSFGRQVSVAFGILSACQFHTIFWASRPLPNIFAFPLVILAFSHWVSAASPSDDSNEHLLSSIRYITFAMVIFRFELILLLASIVLLELWLGNLKFFDALRVFSSTALVSLGLSTIIDSYFWQELTWPEGSVFYFNIVLGKSVEWGVLPFHAYFTSFLPRLLLTSGPLSVLSVFTDARTRRFLLPMLIYLVGFSRLEHKEWRFIVYVVPIFNMCAAMGWVSMRRKGFKFINRFIIVLLLLSFLASIAIMFISSINYPGGVALQRIHLIQKEYSSARIHLDVYTAMTGASRFGQLRNDWEYYKNETHSSPADYLHYTHLLTSDPEMHEGNFRIIDIVDGYARVQVVNPNHLVRNWLNFDFGRTNRTLDSLLPVKILTEQKIWIMKRKFQN
ncbi:3327_t:CDS:2, partial [Acaulospora morrowiae]